MSIIVLRGTLTEGDRGGVTIDEVSVINRRGGGCVVHYRVRRSIIMWYITHCVCTVITVM